MLVKCACGCGKEFEKYDSRNRERRFIHGHNNGIGEQHRYWKGDKVGYYPLHSWVKRHKPKPEECEVCKKRTDRLDASNISGKYLRDINDYHYLCQSCHRKKEWQERFRGRQPLPENRRPHARSSLRR